MKNNQAASHGGPRPGAGRKKGAANKASQARQAEVAASGETPLDYMLRVMRDLGADEKRRDEMARAAAAYVHPKLSAVALGGDPNAPPIEVTRIELVGVRPGGDPPA